MSASLRIAAPCALAIATLASACDAASEHVGPPRRFVLADAITLTLPVDAAWIRTVESERLLLEHEGVVLRVQAIPMDAGSSRRSAESVAAALAARYALGEQPGALSHAACLFASIQGAQCLTGTFERDGVLWARRGAVLETDGHVVWLDVVGPAERGDEIELWSRALSRRASLTSGS